MDNKFVEEASTLGLPPGTWPKMVFYSHQIWKRWDTVTSNGEITAVIYTNNKLEELHILND